MFLTNKTQDHVRQIYNDCVFFACVHGETWVYLKQMTVTQIPAFNLQNKTWMLGFI